MLSSNALVTGNLPRSEAVKAEATGLRANDTWSDESVEPLAMLKQQAAKENRRVKIAHLHTLCGLRASELRIRTITLQV